MLFMSSRGKSTINPPNSLRSLFILSIDTLVGVGYTVVQDIKKLLVLQSRCDSFLVVELFVDYKKCQ